MESEEPSQGIVTSGATAFEARMRSVVVDGARIAYVDEGEGEPILLLHGYVGNHLTWRKLIGPLAEGHRIIAPDWLGWGDSDRNPHLRYDYDTEVARIVSFLDAVGVDRVNCFAHDYGAHLALGLCLRRPERVLRLGLLNSRAHRTFRPEWVLFFGLLAVLSRASLPGRLAYAALPIESIHRWAVRREARNGTFDPETLETFVGWMSKDSNGPAFLRRFFRDYGLRTRPDLVSGLGRISCPTAVVWGEDDPFVPKETPRELAAGIPGAVLTMIPGAGHFVAEECPKEVGRALGKLLERAPRHDAPAASSCHGRRFTTPVEGGRP